ncbi:DsbA family protein [Halobellus ruber]|uniref:Thioredoxin domain-containing protein n=1 Tax=Halobellus ruber TaxID=2761102 RepID=A0A7J9SJH7_9EURY|nr:thioredoxin domain-containing protein [Halobellus ruber]MBB6646137.1 thioredoxin domain-containing protein [Halobellus ruber]
MPTTRRSYLAAVGGAAAVGATAGCLGGGSASALPDGCDVGSLDTVSSLPRPTLGPTDAPVTVDVFEDYACPHCQTFTQETYPEIKSKYIDPGEIRYRFFDFPIPVDEQWSWRAASAARAVQDRTDAETFFAFAKGVFDDQSRLPEEGYQVVREVADGLGVDGCTVAAAAEQEPYRSVVEADRQEGRAREVPGTPAIFVNGEGLRGYEWGTVDVAIRSELEDAG